MYRFFPGPLLRLLLVCALGCPSFGASAASLENVLAKMDEAAAAFRGMQARLNKTSYTAVIKDKSVESGSIAMRRAGAKSVQVLIDFTEPDRKSIAFRDRKAQIFYPKINTVQEWDLGKFDALLGHSLLIGFGASGRDLARSYTMKLIGEETLGNLKAAKLELTPRTAALQEYVTRIEIWIADSDTYPLQTKLYQPSGDYMLVSYSEVKLNPNLSDEDLKLRLPKGVKKEYPQK